VNATDVLGLVHGLVPSDRLACLALADLYEEAGREWWANELREKAERKGKEEEKQRQAASRPRPTFEHRIAALAIHLGVPEDELEGGHNDWDVDHGRDSYIVATDDEVESLWDESLESYLDDGGVEGADSMYFDREAWKRDARHDGAAHCLATYDGNEDEVAVEGIVFRIFRTN